MKSCSSTGSIAAADGGLDRPGKDGQDWSMHACMCRKILKLKNWEVQYIREEGCYFLIILELLVDEEYLLMHALALGSICL